MPRPPFVHELSLAAGAPAEGYPFDLPAVRALAEPLALAPVTVLVGGNGTGKSTLIEALAMVVGFNAEGGGRHLRFETTPTHSELYRHLRVHSRRRARHGWFLRAETFYGMASAGQSTPEFGDFHAMSHGESFLELLATRFAGTGLYLLDEPESALSFTGQLQLVRLVHDRVAVGSQFVIATHSPVLMRIPGARIIECTRSGMAPRQWDELEVVALWRRFLEAPEAMLDVLLDDGD